MLRHRLSTESLTAEQAWAIVHDATGGHAGCDASCDAQAAARAGLDLYAAEYLVSAGVDDSGRLKAALERLDPGGARRAEEWEAFAKLPYVCCDRCEKYYYAEEAECCGKRLRAESPAARRAHAGSAPHGRCAQVGSCLEHVVNPKVKPCR